MDKETEQAQIMLSLIDAALDAFAVMLVLAFFVVFA